MPLAICPGPRIIHPDEFVVAGTGHRPDKLVGGYTIRGHARLVDLCYEWLMEWHPAHIISGMALGFDQALACAAILAKIPFTAAIPFNGQELRWPGFSQGRYKTILEKAEKIVRCSSRLSNESNFREAAVKMEVRNRWMCDNADLVLSLWNGTSGGTKNAIDYCNHPKVNRPVENIWDRYEALVA